MSYSKLLIGLGVVAVAAVALPAASLAGQRQVADAPELAGVRAHADGSVSLVFQRSLETECPASNAPRIVASETSQPLLDLAYSAFERNRVIVVNLAPGCTSTGQPIVESLEVSTRSGRAIREDL